MGTHTFVGERLQQLKGCLQSAVVNPEYIKENYKDLPADHEISITARQSHMSIKVDSLRNLCWMTVLTDSGHA